MTPKMQSGGSLTRLVGAAEENRLLDLYDRAKASGFSVSYCWRDDSNGVCRRVVNVNKDIARWCWRFYTPETHCEAIEEALNEAIKLYGNKPSVQS